MAEHDRGIDHAAIEFVEHLARGRDPHFQHEPGLGAAHALEQQRQFVADDMMADADHEPPLLEAE